MRRLALVAALAGGLALGCTQKAEPQPQEYAHTRVLKEEGRWLLLGITVEDKPGCYSLRLKEERSAAKDLWHDLGQMCGVLP